MDKPVVIMKLDGLPEYILSKDLALRCEKELGYAPTLRTRWTRDDI
jgi:hypothetical protein